MSAYPLPPLSEPDTHCYDDDTQKDVWSWSRGEVMTYAEAARAPLLGRIAELEASVKRLRNALGMLIDAADTSDDYRYGTLGTTFVRGICEQAMTKEPQATEARKGEGE